MHATQAPQASTISIMVAAFALTLLGCGPAIDVKPFTAEELARLHEQSDGARQRGHRIEPGDTLQIRFPYHPELDQDAVVRPDGKTNVSGVGAIDAAGLTPGELEIELKQRSSVRLKDPQVVVNILKFGERQVFVGGEVGRPGTMVFRKGLTPLQAIIAAGGFLPTARLDSVILVRPQAGDQPYIARKLDLERVVAGGEKEPILLTPDDVIFVPRTPIANANVWVRQHVTDLLPFLRSTMHIPGLCAG